MTGIIIVCDNCEVRGRCRKDTSGRESHLSRVVEISNGTVCVRKETETDS